MASFFKLDLDQWEPPEAPAKPAKVANLPVGHPDQRQKAAGLATLADLPGDVVDGVRRLKVMRPPRLLRPDAWSIVVGDAALLVESGWAASALEFGWSTVEIFGAVPDLAGDPAGDGLAVWLAGRKLRMITAKYAVVEGVGGGRSYFARREAEGAVLLWQLGNQKGNCDANAGLPGSTIRISGASGIAVYSAPRLHSAGGGHDGCRR